MRLLVAAAVIAAGVPAGAYAQAAPDSYAEHLLGALKQGKIAEGLAGIEATSVLMKGKLGPSSDMAKQLQTMLDTYGPITGWERVSSEAMGTMLRRDTYIVQHRHRRAPLPALL